MFERTGLILPRIRSTSHIRVSLPKCLLFIILALTTPIFSESALALAVKMNDPEMVSFLLKNGAKNDLKDKDSKQALDYAKDDENGRTIRKMVR